MAQSPIPDDPHNNAENSSPSDFHSSVETSPAIVPLSEPAASDSGHSPSSTSNRHLFQHRSSLDIQKSVSAAGRGGCWCVPVSKLTSLSAPLTHSSPVFPLPATKQDLPSPTKSTSFDSASSRPHMDIVNSPARFFRDPLACLISRNVTSSAKKAMLVVPAAVCSSTASDGAPADQIGCGCVTSLHPTVLPLGMP